MELLEQRAALVPLPRVYPGAGTMEKAMKELRELELKRMPATIVVTAGFDMLRDAGRSLARKLEREGVSVVYLNYPTLIHGFLQWSGVVSDAEPFLRGLVQELTGEPRP